ncbi:MAG: ABC transporter substrate-binding protein [Gallionellaceae bacterium]|jgi:ABC-type oligopeptide transport system substrate-binding subunit|nr:ABC transporter substrate-binding protein [Gallionellaceae bacterium]
MKRLACLFLLAALAACDGGLWNDPYPQEKAGEVVYYTAFPGRPKHLDPAQSYSTDENTFLAQIYQSPLQYHYLKRPYTLEPQATDALPQVRYYDKDNKPLPQDAPVEKIAFSVYELHFRSDLRYQPHPALAQDAAGNPRYMAMMPQDWNGIHTLTDFKETGSRAVLASDYAYGIKRLAHPDLSVPIFSVMSEHIVGLKEYAATLKQARKQQPQGWLDLNKYSLSGVETPDDHTLRVKVYGKYPQFSYWLAMHFFAPIPWEAEKFYAQPGMRERNLSLDWWPLGSGPYYLSENDPNRRMVLSRNPNFSGEFYPSEGAPGDKEAGLLDDAGKPLPLIDKVVFTLEKEDIPRWNKFLQGYYDASGISSDSFDQAVHTGAGGESVVTDAMQAQGISLSTSVAATTYYMGFNWLDPVVGGASERARKLRQAISIAVDWEEFISIFLNGRGIAAQSPIPPGIFGYREGEAGINHYVYDWANGEPRRKSLDEARKLLADAGYPGGVDEKTKQPLVLYLDTTGAGLGDKSHLDWLRKQFEKLNIQLVIRSTDFNRFQDKLDRGDTQMYFFGWLADYPDPENFLFLLDGAQAKVGHGGENYSNYSNPEYDKLFDRMKNMDNGPERQKIVDEMTEILRHDAPWMWGEHPKDFVLRHAWLRNGKTSLLVTNNIKYIGLDTGKRDAMRRQWNKPSLWPLALLVVLVVALAIGLRRVLRQREEAR